MHLSVTKSGFWIIVLIVVAIGIFFRYDFYPKPYFFDDQIPRDVIAYMEKHHTLDTNWGNVSRSWWLPQYDNQYNFSSYITTLFYVKQALGWLGFHPEPLVLYRLLSTFFQVIAGVVMFAVAIRWFGRSIAVVSLFFFAVTPLFTIYAHYARPESYLVLLVSLLLWTHFSFIDSKQQYWIFSTAFLWGLMIGSKISFIPLAVISLVWLMSSQKKIAPGLLGISLSFLLAFCTFSPFMLLNIHGVILGVLFLLNQYLGSSSSFNNLNLHLLTPSINGLPLYLFFYLGPLCWFFIFVGLLNSHQRTICFVRISLILSGIYVLFFSLTIFMNESNIIHFAPLWSLLFGIGFMQCVLYLKSAYKHNLVFFSTAALLLITLAFSFYVSLRLYQFAYHDYSGAINKKIMLFENHLLEAQPHSHILSNDQVMSRLGDVLSGKISADTIIQIAWLKQDKYDAIHANFLAAGYVLLGEVTLPLGNLPRSNIDSLRFPASYRYYQKAN